jgi:histidine ammonia-lyase
VEFHAPTRTSQPLQSAIAALREVAAPYTEDRFFAPDIEAATALVEAGNLTALVPGLFS